MIYFVILRMGRKWLPLCFVLVNLLNSSSSRVSCFERIWESDCIISSDDQRKLLSSVEKMRLNYKGPQTIQRFLINPYRYCLNYKRLGHHNKTSGEDRSETRDFGLSTHLACLPTDYYIPSTGEPAKRSSYINGVNCVDPEFTDVYTSLDGILNAFVPLFEKVLTDLHRNHPLPRRIVGTCHYSEWDEPESPDFSDDDEALSSYLSELKLWSMNRPIELPDISESGYLGTLHRRQFHVSLAGKTLQVYYSLMEYDLVSSSSHQPSIFVDHGIFWGEKMTILPPTSWTVEGMKNENVVACGYYVCSLVMILHSIVRTIQMLTEYRIGKCRGHKNRIPYGSHFPPQIHGWRCRRNFTHMGFRRWRLL